MRSGPLFLAATLLLTGANGAVGQTRTPAPAPQPTEQKTSSTSSVDVEQLPVSLGRIGRQLRQATEREERDGVHLRYTVDVYGQAPRLQIFTPLDNLRTGPVPWSGPTHQDMINIVTPQQFRAPAMDFSALMRWLADRDKNKK